MEFKDYYKIMGVSPEASQEEIKRSYRGLARKYHPDVSKEANAETKFKEIGEAYEALKDPEKRKAYDELRQGGWREGQEYTPPPNQRSYRGFSTGNMDEDTAQFSDFFSSLFGGRAEEGFSGGFRRGRTARRRGEDLQHSLSISLEEAFRGGTRTLQLTVPEMTAHGQVAEKVHTLNVKIPAGVAEGQQIRLAKQGGPGANGGAAGDLYLQLHIEPHQFFHLHKRDVTLHLPITPWEAALGGSVDVPTLGGKISLKIPANSQTGNKLRLKGRGLPGNPAGDQYVIFQIHTPPADNEAIKTLYKQMAETSRFNPRTHLGI
jgi:curved DNA-binding protein